MMNLKHHQASIFLVALLSSATYSAPRLALDPGSWVRLSGTSTLHPYASTSTLTQIFADLAPEAIAQASATVRAVLVDIAHRAPFQRFEVILPVKGLKSGESGLDKNMYKSLKAAEAPEIRFTLVHYEALPAGSDDVLPFKATGQLSIAGVQKEIVLIGTAQTPPDTLVMDGQYELRMSDYGIKPPTLLLGAIKVGDPVVIHFRLSFQLIKGDSK